MNKGADFDLCVIGGGINGCGIARDAAGQGLKVLLVEQGDLAGATSSASTKLIHGGLRYLEFYEFKLVREALKERSVLLRLAPHIIWPMDFILPHHPGLRPRWLIRLGLFLYDALGWPGVLKFSKMLNLRKNPVGQPLDKEYTSGFRYSDCWVQDSRLVIENALDARVRGADIRSYTKCVSLNEKDGMWHVGLQPEGAAETSVTARAVINAAGPWVDQFLQNTGASKDKNLLHVRLVKGSHIIVPRQYEGEQAYILQQSDGRIVFVIPYEHDFTLIGTTEENYDGDPADAKISPAETRYLIEAYNGSLKGKIDENNIVQTYSGVRPLYDDGQDDAKAVTRDYRFHRHKTKAPFLSIYGGKLTTYRKLSEQAVRKICAALGHDFAAWTDKEALPGAYGGYTNYDDFYSDFSRLYPFLPDALLRRYILNYGVLMQQFLKGCHALDDLGAHYGDGVYEAEIDYLISREWARSIEDILWRRSKLELHISERTKTNIAKALQQKLDKKDE